MMIKLVFGVILSLCILIVLLLGLNYLIGPFDDSLNQDFTEEYKIIDIETYYTHGFLYTNKQIKITYMDNNSVKSVVASPGSINYIDTHNESKIVIINNNNYFPQYEIYIKV